jgi:hypothetical protein
VAEVHIITKAEEKAKNRAAFRIICKGVSEEEFADLYNTFNDVFGCSVVLRNPFPQFDAKSVHEMCMWVTGSIAGGYAGKAVIDAAKELFVAYMKYRFLSASQDARPGSVKLLYGPDNKVLYNIKGKNKSKKR